VKQYNYKPLLIILILLVWLSHFIQVLVPETGFDALWYHLPVIKAVIENKGLVYLPDLYQSINPLFSDLYFALGYLFLGELGTKIVAYLFALGLIFVSYKLSIKFLKTHWSLLLILLISTFQAISWQSASFYVDIAKAFFEISSLLFLYYFIFDGSVIVSGENKKEKKLLLISALLFGASLATKLFSIFLLPVYLLIVFIFSKSDKIKNSLLFLLSSLVLPFPYYLFAYLKTGNPFYSFMIHIDKLGEIGGNSSPLIYIFERITKLPYSLFELFLSKDYVSFIFLLFLPLVIYNYKKVLIKKNLFLFIFSIFQYLLWWFLPPTSSRYAISGFIVLTIFYFKIINYFIKENRNYFLPVVISIILSSLINFAPRLIVNVRSLRYITGQQNKEQYLKQFLDGSIDNNLKEWHFGTTLYKFN